MGPAITIFDRLRNWNEQGVISNEQHGVLAGLARGEPLSVFLELNILLYAGILAFIGGLGWTITTWSQQIGDLAIIVILSALFAVCLWYCFSRTSAWSPQQVPAPNLIFDYVLYLGCLTWSVELAFLETRFHLLSGKWDSYLLATAGLFFALAYRFDNRLVLSLALSALAGWFGLTLSRWPSHEIAAYRSYAILYSMIVAIGGAGLSRYLKPHFLGTYLNLAANVLFWALLSGVLELHGHGGWLLCLLAVCAASLAWGISRREFSFVAYATVYGYIGISAVLVRNLHDFTLVLYYFIFTGIGMIVMLVFVARRFGRNA